MFDVVGRKQTAQADPDTTSALVLGKTESSRNELPESRRAAEEGENRITDPLIQGLIERLPKPDSAWSLDGRAKWLNIANSIFDLVYSADDDEQRKIEVEIVEQDPCRAGTRPPREGDVRVAPSLSTRLRPRGIDAPPQALAAGWATDGGEASET